MYEAVTRDVRVRAEPFYLSDQSDPAEGRYFWAYRITITNQGAETVRLISRYWRITDATGQAQEVRGEGVVGEQPTLHPEESFEYTSGAPLATATGFMGGSYQMVTENGEWFDVEIPTFSLDSPHQSTVIH